MSLDTTSPAYRCLKRFRPSSKLLEVCEKPATFLRFFDFRSFFGRKLLKIDQKWTILMIQNFKTQNFKLQKGRKLSKNRL